MQKGTIKPLQTLKKKKLFKYIIYLNFNNAEGDNQATSADWSHPQAQTFVRLTQEVFKI